MGFYNPYFSTKISAICTALSAAPFFKLSATTHKERPYLTEESLRILDTKTGSFAEASIGVTNFISCGLSMTIMPSLSSKASRASFGVIALSNSTLTASECELNTGTRTQVAST